MRLLLVAILSAALSTLLVITLLGYRHDQRVVRMFPGTGIAGKLDTLGAPPAYVLIENRQSGKA
jgi:hypothetical protein